MPPRYAYWTIIAGGLPTAFRAAEREELLPTFQRIKEKHPDAEMKWFARGKLWESPDAARIRHDDGRGRPPLGEKRGAAARDRDDARRTKPHGRPGQEKRGRDWRPGGEHRDPRQKFVDAKKQQNAALRKERWDRKNAPPRAKPYGDPVRPEISRHPRPAARDHWRDRPRENRGAKPGNWRDRPAAERGAKPERPWRERPPREGPGPQGQPDRQVRGPQGRGEWRQTPRPDEPKVPTPVPTPRGHIKSRRPFRPRNGPPKGPRR